jgi:hypothetical protein
VKAKIRALIILLILCLFLAALYTLLPAGSGGPSPVRRDSPDTVVTITDIPAGEMQALAITNGGGIFGVLNGPGGVTAVSNRAGPFDDAKMRALVYMACHLTGIRRLDKLAPPDDGDMANSLARFTLILTGNREYNFAILRENPVGDGYFLFFAEEKSLFLIPGASAEWFLRKDTDFLSEAASG